MVNASLNLVTIAIDQILQKELNALKILHQNNQEEFSKDAQVIAYLALMHLIYNDIPKFPEKFPLIEAPTSVFPRNRVTHVLNASRHAETYGWSLIFRVDRSDPNDPKIEFTHLSRVTT
jgi:hypothetical protein